LSAGRLPGPHDIYLLKGLMPRLSGLSNKEWDSLLQGAQVVEAPANSAIIRRGDPGDEI
jgi:hypothetical protein